MTVAKSAQPEIVLPAHPATTTGPRQPRGTADAATGASVRVRGVIRVFREGPIETVALQGLDLDVAPGEFVAIVGRSGSGKSTLLHLLAGDDRPTAGSIMIDGIEIGQASEADRARIRGRVVGSVFQADNLVMFLDLVENLQLAASLAGSPITRSEAVAVLESLGLGPFAGRRAGQLSGGEQQRAALGLVLATQPWLLLADEITGELDSETAAVVLDALQDIRRQSGMTLLLATHDREVASRADRVVEIRDGRDVRPVSIGAKAGSRNE